ncbi:MAG: thiosulfate oxidation carrier complex protein SoxZ [Hyphomonadaceae bacterium]|nr:thiosulfate oxidation carrier complex protein SoxZ [Hyphomonadaceae bacterium]
MAVIRISAPETAEKNEVIEIKAMIQHPMETGYRRDERGDVIPRDIITNFRCGYNGEIVFEAEFLPGIAANPFLTFYLRATHSGSLNMSWTDQDGQSWSATHALTVA